MNNIVETITPAHLKKQLEEDREMDFSYFVPGVGRFRTNLFQQRGQWCLAMRYVQNERAEFRGTGPAGADQDRSPNRRAASCWWRAPPVPANPPRSPR